MPNRPKEPHAKDPRKLARRSAYVMNALGCLRTTILARPTSVNGIPPLVLRLDASEHRHVGS